MAKVIIYSADFCPYCKHAKALFDRKGVAYEVIEIDGSDEARADMAKKTNGARTIPQIVINGEHIGGFDDAQKLDKAGKLDELLKLQ